MGMGNGFGITTGGAGPGLLDFVALLTGNTAKQRSDAKLEHFVNNELPEFGNNILNAKTEEQLRPHAIGLIKSGLAAGLPEEGVLKLLDKLQGAAHAGMAADQYAAKGRELGPQTTVTDKPVNLPAIEGPFGPGLEQANLTVPELTTTPGRSFSPADAFSLAATEARTGVKIPAGLSSLLKAPSEVAQREAEATAANRLASQRQVQQAIDARRLKVLEDLPENEIAPGITTRTLGLATEGKGLTSMIPQREKPESAIETELKKSQIERNRATAARTKAAGNVGEMKPAQLIQLRNSVRSQLKAAQDSFDDVETASLQAQLGMIDDEIQKKGKVLFKPDNNAPAGKPGKPSGKKPTVQSVKQKFGIR